MIPGSPQTLIQSQTAGLSIQILLTEHDTGYNTESPVGTPTDDTQFTDEIAMNGYKTVEVICDTLQGRLYKAIDNKHTHATNDRHNYVAIKQTHKYLSHQRIAIEDENSFCVSESILKESIILKHLTVDNKPLGGYICNFIDFFESNDDYFLVMEYVESECNLKQFVSNARQYIENGKLSANHYQKMVKYLLWQLCVTIQWMHASMHCCHLDLCMENIMVANANFIESRDKIVIDPQISIKLTDFGVSEVFDVSTKPIEIDPRNAFLCQKQGLSITNEGYFAPEVFNGQIFDAHSADNWSLGMILFQCLTLGEHLYKPLDMYAYQSGYWAVCHNRLKEYLRTNDLISHFNSSALALLLGLLTVNDRKRLHGINLLRHKYFSMYADRYMPRVLKKFSQTTKMKRKSFPFYRM